MNIVFSISCQVYVGWVLIFVFFGVFVVDFLDWFYVWCGVCCSLLYVCYLSVIFQEMGVKNFVRIEWFCFRELQFFYFFFFGGDLSFSVCVKVIF